MTTKPLTYAGFAVCPVGQLRRDADGDSMRSNLLSDGRVFNIFTGYSHPIPPTCNGIFTQPRELKNLVAALISTDKLAVETFRLTSVGNQLDGRDLADVGTALAAHDVDVSALDNSWVAFNAGTCLQSLRISYGSNVAECLADQTAGADDHRAIEAATAIGAPAVILTAAEKLVAAGFRSAAPNFDGASLRKLTFLKGGEHTPVRAELTWII